ncbi:hypothetical protein LIER_10462 [Lithospermum erythrorhizon]|uniref:Uncharacterized protein n=1 Tax=Lithospermum erythrorhizon TaxID=34254 RepID=A0AAV3PL56_LITER
MGHLFPEW